MKIFDGYHSLNLPTPSENWRVNMSPKQREFAKSKWSEFVSWVSIQGDSEFTDSFVDRKLLALYDSLMSMGIRYPTGIVFALGCDVAPVLTPLGSKVVDRIVHAQAVLDLFRECLALQELSAPGTAFEGPQVFARSGPARNPWERMHELNSSEARWDFAQGQMRMLGFSK